MSTPVIEASGLTKRYGGTAAVDHIDLTVEEGEILGLLGPNGAGKTTTILMLLGLTEPTEGSVRVLGRDPLREPLAVKRHVGYLPDAVGFYDTLSGRENLRYSARLAGLDETAAQRGIATALERVGLSGVGDRRVATYSRGMRQRLGLAELLMRDVRVVILDEPTSGLDPRSTSELLSLIREFAAERMTVLLSSHLLDVVQSICSRVALFNAGRIGFLGTVDDLVREVADGAFHIDVGASGIDIGTLAPEVKGVTACADMGDGHWQITAARDVRSDLARRIVARGGALTGLDARRISLGEAYNRFFREAGHEA
ncbi:ABC transporter ATP-binding protein [Zhengella mangrovi]|uniref:ABC transporter ATP-binding protein n=1 Tax=Zhengella mangrovi TaxID=1982044 RepID=A0A2G1QT44_9HYPH|nr:ABC transporter ATP-binding protein [Zhengella mangrovi]PHP68665.1 ABC transporter ATP-binding protein [Zhengella mangrovi]